MAEIQLTLEKSDKDWFENVSDQEIPKKLKLDTEETKEQGEISPADSELLDQFPTEIHEKDSKKLTKIGLIDSHCHLDFIFARLEAKKMPCSSFAQLQKRFQCEFPEENRFRGCIAGNFNGFFRKQNSIF